MAPITLRRLVTSRISRWRSECSPALAAEHCLQLVSAGEGAGDDLFITDDVGMAATVG